MVVAMAARIAAGVVIEISPGGGGQSLLVAGVFAIAQAGSVVALHAKRIAGADGCGREYAGTCQSAPGGNGGII